MKKKLMQGGPSAGPTNVVSRSYTSPPNTRPVEEIRDKTPTHEMDGESCLNKSVRTTVTVDLARRHPFTNVVIEVPPPDKWKGLNRDRYDGSNDPDEHMVAYTAEGTQEVPQLSPGKGQQGEKQGREGTPRPIRRVW